MSVIARFWTAAAQAAGAVAAWHLLGPAWALGLAVLVLSWSLPYAVMPPSATAMEKARAVEKRLNAVVGQIPAPQDMPATASDSSYSASDGSSSASNSSYSTSNSSYGMSGGTQVTYTAGSGNNGGGSGSQTSGQIGGASAHVHDMTHYHTSSSDLQSVFNALRDSHSNLVPAFNTLRDSHSDLVPTVNTLRGSHGNLVTAVNALRGSHATVVSRHNGLLAVLGDSGLLR